MNALFAIAVVVVFGNHEQLVNIKLRAIYELEITIAKKTKTITIH